MFRRILNYIFSTITLLPLLAHGQEEVTQDSVKGSFIPTGIRIGWDAMSTANTFINKNFKGWEVNADVDFRNYYLALEAGHWERKMNLENGNYSNSGNYWRVGIDINLLKKDPMRNMFFLGFRIGRSKYDEYLNYSDTTEFGIFNKSLVNDGLTAGWAELTTGLKIKVLKNFWMGYTARMKFFASYSKDQNLQSYDIPGYGLTFKKPWWGFTYYLMYRIPIRKENKKS